MELKIEYVPIGSIEPYANNAKLHPAEQVEQIKKSISEFGFNDPIAVWKNGEIIEGHGRLIAAIEMGLDEVPIIRLDELTDEQRRAYILVHNKITMNSGFSTDLLSLELSDITDIDMSAFGFEDIFGEDENESVQKDIDWEEKYQVIIEVENEEEQRTLYEKMIASGYKCKLSTL